jgi:hypothetical protein
MIERAAAARLTMFCMLTKRVQRLRSATISAVRLTPAPRARSGNKSCEIDIACWRSASPTNAFTELARTLSEYRAEIAKDEQAIAWGLLFGLGVMLENSADAARRDIADRLMPPLEDTAQSALHSLVTLHGPLILASKEGQELQDQADRLRMTREEQLGLRADAEILATKLRQSPDVIEPIAADIVDRAVQVGEAMRVAL